MKQSTATSSAAPPDATRGGRAATFGAVALLVIALVVISQGRVPQGVRLASLVMLLFEQGVIVLAYLAAAAGWGYAVAGLIRERAFDVAGFPGRVILGVGVMALLMWLLGWAGYLNAPAAWTLGTLGWVLAGWQIYHERDRWWLEPAEQWPTLPWPILLAVPAGALLLGAACIPPGVLWSSEAGGYDALSYHLELPRAWIEAGAIEGLRHNVYAFFPSLFEVAFAQLGLWRGGMVEASYTAQLLHGSMAILAALVIGRIVAERVHNVAGAMAGGLYLATPWTIVTGSLAYNEQAVAAFAAVALAVTLKLDEAPAGEPRSAAGDVRAGGVVGLFVGLAVLAKLTAAGMVALPMAVLLAMNSRGGRPRQLARLAGFFLASVVVVGLFLIRNALWTGNPLFPMLTGLFGTAHWTPEQAARWSEAHSGNPLAGLADLVTAGFLHVQYAWVVWPLAIAAAVFAWRGAATGRIARLMVVFIGVQLLFWLLMTHHQSRFLIPLLVPACVLIGASLPAWRSTRLAAGALAAAIVFVTILSFGLYLKQHEGAAAYWIDRIEHMRYFQRQPGLVTPYNMINRGTPPDARIYAEAFATPYYITREMNYSTVWDASPIGPHLAEGGAEQAHAWLLEQGYTHVVIDWNMLGLWRSEGNYGYDPHVEPDQLQRLAAEHLRQADEAAGITLYTIRPR